MTCLLGVGASGAEIYTLKIILGVLSEVTRNATVRCGGSVAVFANMAVTRPIVGELVFLLGKNFLDLSNVWGETQPRSIKNAVEWILVTTSR
jgi:hypothetical protein